MAIFMFPFWLLDRILGLFRGKTPKRQVNRFHPNRSKKRTAAIPSKCAVPVKETGTKASIVPKAASARQGTLYKGIVQSFGTATCESGDGRTYRSFVVRLKDRDGTVQEVRGVDLQPLVDAGKIVKGNFIRILASRQYLRGSQGRRVWKNAFSIV